MKLKLDTLNESQYTAVTYSDGPQLVIAGAGSGKTRVLTYKIAYLLEQGYKPWEILALTFTNKAADEMKGRIADIVGGEKARYLNMGTFHSVFARILRAEASTIGYASNFSIYNESDSRSLLKTIIKELGLEDKIYRPSSVHNTISLAKNHLITAGQYELDNSLIERDSHNQMKAIHSIYRHYENRCRLANAMDFDDLLLLTYTLLKNSYEARVKYASKFQYILVDEYQDTNYAQQQILTLLTESQRRICVVGDDAQSIYAFRGANIDNILNFQTIYPEAKLMKLERNYRSTQNIVLAANSLIKHNSRQIPKEVYSEKEEGEKLVLKRLASDREEAIVVCNDLLKIHRKENCDFRDFAILYRTNAQSRPFEEELRKKSIPYKIYGGLSFYQRKEIVDILAYFRMAINPHDEEALKRTINYPTRGIGNTTLSKISERASKNQISLWSVIDEPEKYGLILSPRTMEKVLGYRNLIRLFVEQSTHIDAYEVGRQILQDSGIQAEIYASKDIELISRQQNIEALLNGMQEFVEEKRENGLENEVFLSDFLQVVSLQSELDTDSDETNKVSLMTVHAAKGLEFETVFIAGLEENIFPSMLSSSNLRDLEEERRLFYVAITRAQKHCFLTCAENRWRYGKMMFGNPSRFIEEIAPEYLSDLNSKMLFSDASLRTSFNTSVSEHPSKKSVPLAPKLRSIEQITKSSISSVRAPSLSSIVTGDGKICVGTVISHQRFGIGTVNHIEGEGENTKATVTFQNSGTKQLLLKFARFTIVK